MNKERIEKLKQTAIFLRDAEVISGNVKFDMSAWAREEACGTALCLAGWYVHLQQPPDLVIDFCGVAGGIVEPGFEKDSTTNALAKHFDLPREVICALFCQLGNFEDAHLYHQHRAFACRLLRQIDWLEDKIKIGEGEHLVYEQFIPRSQLDELTYIVHPDNI